jgi:hypothetical protein
MEVSSQLHDPVTASWEKDTVVCNDWEAGVLSVTWSLYQAIMAWSKVMKISKYALEVG